MLHNLRTRKEEDQSRSSPSLALNSRVRLGSARTFQASSLLPHDVAAGPRSGTHQVTTSPSRGAHEVTARPCGRAHKVAASPGGRTHQVAASPGRGTHQVAAGPGGGALEDTAGLEFLVAHCVCRLVLFSVKPKRRC